MSKTTIDLALPPVDEARHYQWLKGAAAEIETQCGVLRVHGCARIEIRVGLIDAERSLVAITELVSRLLAATIINGPAAITDAMVRWDRAIEPGRMQITLGSARPPVERIGAATRARIVAANKLRWAREKAAAGTAA